MVIIVRNLRSDDFKKCGQLCEIDLLEKEVMGVVRAEHLIVVPFEKSMALEDLLSPEVAVIIVGFKQTLSL